MNLKLYIFLIIPFAVFLSCSPDEDENGDELKIAYVHVDGSPLVDGECINSDSNYAIAITTKLSDRLGDDKPMEIKYTVNGIQYVMTFMGDGTQLNNIKLINGINRAQIIGTGHKTEIVYYSHDDFELVN